MLRPLGVMVKTGIRLLVCFLMFSIPTVAQDHRKDSDDCYDNPNMTQTQLNQCAGRDLLRAESRLDGLLKDLGISKDGPEQKAWKAYRDAQIEAIYPQKDIETYPSVYPMCYAILRTKLTEGRIRDLKALISPGEGDVCAGYSSAKTKHR